MTHKDSIRTMYNYTTNIPTLINFRHNDKKVSFIHMLYNYIVAQKKQNIIILQTNCFCDALHI